MPDDNTPDDELSSLSPIIKRCGTWAVTEYGIECLAEYYPIEAERLWEPDWIEHMRNKEWVALDDFGAALGHGMLIHSKAKPFPPGVKDWKAKRFWILRRDGYACHLCGKTAADGAKLEVDHKHPKSRGGPDEAKNLWTLCFECNRGKAASSL